MTIQRRGGPTVSVKMSEPGSIPYITRPFDSLAGGINPNAWRAGRPPEAVTPLEQVVGFDPAAFSEPAVPPKLTRKGRKKLVEAGSDPAKVEAATTAEEATEDPQ